jgi:hypothetical protein
MPQGGLLSAPAEILQRQMDFATTHTIALARVLQGKVEEEGGRFVALGSIAGQRKPSLSVSTYSLSKAVLEQTVRLLAPELARKKITINAICPSFIPTGMNEQSDARARKSRLLASRSAGCVRPKTWLQRSGSCSRGKLRSSPAKASCCQAASHNAMRLVRYTPEMFPSLQRFTTPQSGLSDRSFVDYYYATREHCQLYLALDQDGSVIGSIGIEQMPFEYRGQRQTIAFGSNFNASHSGVGGFLYLEVDEERAYRHGVRGQPGYAQHPARAKLDLLPRRARV